MRTDSSLKKVPIYFFYGDQVDEILRLRDQAIDLLLGRENRDGNLTEFMPPANRKTTSLAEILPELAADMATMSFIAEAAKVAVVTNPAELFASEYDAARRAAKPKKATGKKKSTAGDSAAPAEAPYVEWFQKLLPETGNHVILLAFEDEGESRQVNQAHPLLQVIGRIGHMQRFGSSGKQIFAIEDAILRRDFQTCLSTIRELWTDKMKMRVLTSIVRCMRFMLQATISRERKLSSNPELAAICLPSSNLSLYQSKDFIIRKYEGATGYRTMDLLKTYERLLEVHEALRPRPDDVFVPDALELLERILMELFMSPRIKV